LTGEEIRPCWEAADAAGTTVPALPGVGPVWPLDPTGERTGVRTLEFVEVTATDPSADPVGLEPIEPAFVAAPAEPRWSLFGELEA
jgi:hypothetical protein